MADIFVYSMIEWHYRWQRPQQIPTALAAAGNRVFYLSNNVGHTQVDRPYTCIRDDERQVFLVSFDVPGEPPNPFVGTLSDVQATSIAKAVHALTRNFQLVDPVGIVQHPFWAPVLERLPGQFIIYDCMDHHAGFGDDAPHLESLEKRTIHRADHVVATSQWIADQIDHPKISRIPNAVDIKHFDHVVRIDRKKEARPRIGYYGAIAHWFDFELVADLARRLPNCDFVLAGEVTSDEVQLLDGIKNVQLLGEIPYQNVPALAATFDVALIPFKIIDLTLATNPVKVFEYAAVGLPVVATDLPELKGLPEVVVSRIDGTEEAIARIQEFVAGEGRDVVEQRKQWARLQTWTDRSNAFELILSTRPLVSIVVLAFNKVELTRACLESIKHATSWPYEVVVVDNASTDGTSDYLKEWEAQSNTNRAVISSVNLGFAGGNNLGIEQSLGEYIVMLNNDTEPASGWLTPLIRSLSRDETIGIVGPATNNSGNESRIHIDDADRASNVHTFLESQPPQFLETRSLAFFCVALRKNVVDSVGPLDTAFGIGMFEDDDYCSRLKNQGYKVGINFQSFVFHHMSASFNDLGSKKQELFERNKAIYEAKWGPWIAHRHLDPLPNSPLRSDISALDDLEYVRAELLERLEQTREEIFLKSETRLLVENQRVALIETLQSQLAEVADDLNENVKVLASMRQENLELHRHLINAGREIEAFRRSRALKLGRLILLPLRIIKKILRISRRLG